MTQKRKKQKKNKQKDARPVIAFRSHTLPLKLSGFNTAKHVFTTECCSQGVCPPTQPSHTHVHLCLYSLLELGSDFLPRRVAFGTPLMSTNHI